MRTFVRDVKNKKKSNFKKAKNFVRILINLFYFKILFNLQYFLFNGN